MTDRESMPPRNRAVSRPLRLSPRAGTICDWPLRYGGYRIDGVHVWGATARILGQLGAIVGT